MFGFSRKEQKQKYVNDVFNAVQYHREWYRQFGNKKVGEVLSEMPVNQYEFLGSLLESFFDGGNGVNDGVVIACIVTMMSVKDRNQRAIATP